MAAGPAELKPYDEAQHHRVLTEHRGMVLLLNMWATWCAPCRAEMPHLAALAVKLGGQGFRLVTVSADEAEDKAEALAFLQRHAVPSPAYLKSTDDDDAFIGAINPEWSGALPASFLYGRDGKLIRAFIGEVDLAELEKAVRAAL